MQVDNSKKRDLQMIQNQRDSYGSIIIVLDKEFYYPGEYITGKILIKVLMDFPSQDLHLSITGIEQLKDIIGREGQTIRKVLYDQAKKGRGNGFEALSDEFKSGKHVIPFKIQLHYNVPGSYKVFDGRIKGKVSHSILCRLEGKGIQLFCKEKVNVRELLNVQPQQNYQAEIYKTIFNCFGCINQKECRILCAFDRHFYQSGDHGILQVLIHNQSNLHIASISATLWNVFSKNSALTQNNQKPFNADNKSSQLVLFKKAIREQIYEGVNANTQETQLNLDFIFVNYNSNLPLPPSVQGTFTVNYYFVEIKAHFEGCSTQSLVLQVPISVILSTKEPPRTMQEIQEGIMSKAKIRQQEKEITIQEFSEQSHYQIIHSEIDLSAFNMQQDISLSNQQASGLIFNQVSHFPRQSYEMNPVGKEINIYNPDKRLQNNDIYNNSQLQSLNTSHHNLLETSQAAKVYNINNYSNNNNDQLMRYSQYKSSFANNLQQTNNKLTQYNYSNNNNNNNNTNNNNNLNNYNKDTNIININNSQNQRQQNLQPQLNVENNSQSNNQMYNQDNNNNNNQNKFNQNNYHQINYYYDTQNDQTPKFSY